MKRVLTLSVFLIAINSVFGQGFEHFITVSGNKLMNGNQEYRFISFNIPTLNYIEDALSFASTNPYDLPNEFEMRDAFATIKEMGGQVIRIYTVPVRNTNFPAEAPTYVEGPGKFNEEAFLVTDKMLELANEYEIRIIFSLLNNWQWMGGVPNYAEFRNKNQLRFWVDKKLRDDFKKTIKFVLTRKNTITGVKYKDDKAILGWETGNELFSTPEWTADIAKYIKNIDKNHLVLDGYYAIDGVRQVRKESITDPNIDVVTSHHYERNPFDIPPHIQKNLDIIKGRKPYLIGEFGFVSTTAVESILDGIIANKDISGALIWGMRNHHRDGGFYYHSEPMGIGIYKSYHWPGFVNGISYDEFNFLQMYRRKAFEIQGKAVPPISKPQSPKLLKFENVYEISWQGSMGAVSYTIERAEAVAGPWEVVGFDVSDANVEYFPLFHDKTAKIGKSYYYRVKAMNASGESEPSNIVGPVWVKTQAVIDNMINYGTLYHSEHVDPATGRNRSFKEVVHRMAGDYGSEMIYEIPGQLKEFRIYSFEEASGPQLSFFTSVGGEKWTPLDVKANAYVSGETNYNYWTPELYRYENPAAGFKYIKIYYRSVAQIARVEIIYTNPIRKLNRQ